MELKKAKKELVNIEKMIKENIKTLNERQEQGIIEMKKEAHQEIKKFFDVTIKKNHTHTTRLGYIELKEMKKEYKLCLSKLNETIDFELASQYVWRHVDYALPTGVDDEKFTEAQEKEINNIVKNIIRGIYVQAEVILTKYAFVLDKKDFQSSWWLKNVYEYVRELTKLHNNMKKEAKLRTIIQEQTALELWKNA